MTDGNVLFAVAGSNAAPLFSLHPDVTFVIALGLSLDDIDASNITVTTDTNGALSIVMMENHLAAPDPHPQYLNNARFNLLLQALIPMGYIHHTHSTANPKPLFDELMGIDTAWRRLTGKIIVATDPNEAAIKDHSVVLGQRGMTDDATSQRPHVYPLQTTHVFERYNPSDAIETVWNVKANKTSITEGGVVRFTVTANNLPDGQILNWSVKEGALNGSNNDITSPDKTDSGTVILRNGQAVIDFTTTPDDNEAEPQKHVRLTIGAPANLSINVPITDAGYNETALHITQSTNNGIDLAEYYKQQSGGYPRSDEVVRFVVDAGVDVVAPNTSTPAMINGAQWPAGNIPTIENRGRILGRGGEGGRSAEYVGGLTVGTQYGAIDSPDRWQFPENGSNGGTAVKGSILIENYGLVSGGGGGGGGTGVICYNIATGLSDDGVFENVGGGGSGGGAPFGKRSPNANTIESFYQYRVPSSHTPYNYSTADVPQHFIQVLPDKTRFHSWYTPVYGVTDKQIPLLDPEFKNKHAAFLLPHYESDGISYRLISYVSEQYVVDKTKPSVPAPETSNSVWENHSVILKQSINGGATLGGAYGYGGTATVGTSNTETDLTMPDHFQSLDITAHHGGNGGDLGMNGKNGVNLVKASLVKLKGSYTGTYAKVYEVPPASGGLAGYIKEGSVTITNFSGGTTKGR